MSVQFDVSRPSQYDRVQLALRLLVMIVLGVVGAPLGWIFGFLYLGLPALAAAVTSQRGGVGYRDEMGPRLARGFDWLLALHAYLALLTDRFPSAANLGVTFEVAPHGEPTVKSSLLRLITSLPTAIVLWLLALVSAPVWVVSAIFILARGNYPTALFDFQRGVLRLFARFLAYHASLVDAGPLSFAEGAASPPAQVTR
jgi:hypothetical protein